MSPTQISVIIATVGRPSEARELVEELTLQTRRPDRIVVSAVSHEDFPCEGLPAQLLIGETRGSCAQRNTALDHVEGHGGLIVFMDDDYLPSRFALERIEGFFARHPDVVGANGRLLADGIKGGGISKTDALRLIVRHDADDEPARELMSSLSGLYGCNMIFRAEAIRGARFDESLPLYGWQEDVDFSARVRGAGRLVRTNAWAGVHRGVKRGRTSGVRFGYSQVANPIYLVGKGTMPAREAYALVVRNVLANHLRALRSEPWVDRAGRVKGNWRAVRDLLRGTLRPEAILDFT